jgi:hypothetical protein
MSDDLIPQYAALLREHYLFRGLDEAQIAHVVTRFIPVTYQAGDVIYRQGSVGDSFFIVYQGSLRTSYIDRGKERHVDIFNTGDYFGEDALILDKPRTFSVEALSESILLRLDREPFFKLVELFPQLRQNLSASAESRLIVQSGKFDWIAGDEVIYLISRKHVFFLWVALVLPVGIGLLAVLLLGYGFGLVNGGQISMSAIAVGGIAALGALLWGIWNWINWGNDYYIVTSRRVLWTEKVVGLYSSSREAPLSQVLAVNVNRSWLGRKIGFGNVDVRTYTGGILMRRMANPRLFAKFVQGFQVRAYQLEKRHDTEKMEQALRLRLGLDSPDDQGISPGDSYDNDDQLYGENQTKDEIQPSSIGTFLKVRYEQNGVITYRKHWLLLFRKTWLPTLGLFVTIGLVALILQGAWAGGMAVSTGLPLSLFFGFLFVVFLGWWAYRYVDWSNDIYQLTPEQIRDIERKPLGNEIKKTAPLDSILSLEHSRDGIFQLLFNYGNVMISVGQTEFVFRGVYNPDQVHHDVADHIEALASRKREAASDEERERMVDWLLTFRRQTELLEEIEKDPGKEVNSGKIDDEYF